MLWPVLGSNTQNSRSPSSIAPLISSALQISSAFLHIYKNAISCTNVLDCDYIHCVPHSCIMHVVDCVFVSVFACLVIKLLNRKKNN